MVDKVIKEDNDFMESWEAKKKENESLHKRAYNKMKKVWCTFTGK